MALYLVSLLSDLLAAIPLFGLILFVLLSAGAGALLWRRRALAIAVAGGGSLLSILFYLLLSSFYQRTLPKVLDFIALFDRLNGFCAGRLDLPTLALYVGVTAIACLLLAQNGKRPTLPRSLIAAVLALCVIAAQLLPFGVAYPSILQGSPYRIPEKARQYLLAVDETVDLIYYAKDGERGADRDVYDFLLSIERINPRIRVSLLDTADTEGAIDQSIEVRSSKRSRSFRVYELYYYFNSGTSSTLSMEEYTGVLNAMEKSRKTDSYNTWLGIYGPGTMKAYFSGAANLTSAIRYVLAKDAPTVYSFVKSGGADIHPLLRQRIEQSGYTVASLSSLDRLSQTVFPLLLTLTEDLTREEASAVSDYLSRGGKLLLTTAYDSPTHPNLSAVLAEYGLSSNESTNSQRTAPAPAQPVRPVPAAPHRARCLCNNCD